MTTTTQAAVTPTEWTLYFPYAKAPLTLNGGRGNHYVKNQWVRRIRNETIAYARQTGIPPMQHAQARLTWYVLDDYRKRDVDNLAPTEKVMFDGLVRAGIVPDDTPDLLHKHRPVIEAVDPMTHREAWMELWVAVWDGTGAPPTPTLTTTGYIQSTI
jgi:crossover junction endodeoxyribonuclease RusA